MILKQHTNTLVIPDLIRDPGLERPSRMSGLTLFRWNESTLRALFPLFFVLLLVFVLLLAVLPVSAIEYHVAKNGNDKAIGTKAKPFKTISHAAKIAKPGDVITVHEGVYRELVAPSIGGASESNRIIYRSAKGEKVEIKGSEITKGWKEIKKGIWEVTLPDSVFKSYNPYKDLIYGDWFFPGKRKLHTGEVYLNGSALYETSTLDKVLSGASEDTPVGVSPFKVLSPAFTWFTLSIGGSTVITANFHDKDPNKELVEINVRPACIYPSKTGVNYITIQGFYMSQAATQWAAPTAEQLGLIGTNWSKGWIIENNTISDSKCVGITLGKDRASGHNVWSADMEKDGAIHYNEMIVRVISNGWNKENIGSHQVKNNTIFNCGAAGICGSFGAAYSSITGNNIYNIYTRRNYYGAEMGGIKIHGAIDVLIKGNRVQNAFIGLWLDWMTQGTRISSNLFVDNDYVDFFPEVNHGPYLVDHNVFLSSYSLKDWSEGGAYAHNLFGGLITRAPQARATPVFRPHTTTLLSVDSIKGGDNRFFNNIFYSAKIAQPVQPKMHSMDTPDALAGYGLRIYNYAVQPIFARGNTYVGEALPAGAEQSPLRLDSMNLVTLIEQAQIGWLKNANHYLPGLTPVPVLNTGTFGESLLSKQGFSDALGHPILLNKDFFGNRVAAKSNVPGPFIKLLK